MASMNTDTPLSVPVPPAADGTTNTANVWTVDDGTSTTASTSDSEEDVEMFIRNNPHFERELAAIRAVLPFDYQPQGVKCPVCTTWIMIKPKTNLKYYTITRGEYVGIFFTQSSAIQSWLRPWSNNFHKSFSDYNEAVKLFNEELAAGRVIDKNGVVASMGDDSPVYVPGSTGLKLSKATDVPVSSSLPTPY